MRDLLKRSRNLSEEERKKIAREMIEGYKKIIEKESEAEDSNRGSISENK